MRARRRFGQHFLEPAWASRLLDAAALGPEDRVVEIGPGRGALTQGLAERVASVTAVEIDRDLAAGLRGRMPANVRIVEADFLELGAADLLPPASAHRIRVVGNLPYNVSSPILFKLLALSRETGRIVDATVMLQREVADRVASPPGSKAYGVLSVMVQIDADVERLLSLPPGAFRPAPEVWSSVIRLVFRPPPVAIGDRHRFEVLVRSLFAHRRKTVANCLRPLAASCGLDGDAMLAAASIDPGCRAETLHLADLARLADTFARVQPPSSVV
ncbi:MAG: 16S rRNA (adenine(1518)-N(6)/adenine(1519)-N(6))-dimethyltransferase RsmA [Acidobacteria bacterium]|nr:16S rRNA (adenine(1518)-N(6)/adenine(1519)-N(6))-dimethyltransferase RsmA [Acidobacteriota bacterium]